MKESTRQNRLKKDMVSMINQIADTDALEYLNVFIKDCYIHMYIANKLNITDDSEIVNVKVG